MSYAGNSTVVNALMRWPVLIPVAVALGVATVVVPKTPPPPVAVVAAVEAPKVVPEPLKPVESLCPPQAKLTQAELAKLTSKERGLLKVRGCIKG